MGVCRTSFAETQLPLVRSLSRELDDAVNEHAGALIAAEAADPCRILDLAQRVLAEVKKIPQAEIKSLPERDQRALCTMQDYAGSVIVIYSPEKPYAGGKGSSNALARELTG